MKKIMSILLAMVLALSLLPMAAAAETLKVLDSDSTLQAAASLKKEEGKDKDKHDKHDKDDKHHKHKRKPPVAKHDHEYSGYGSNPTYHWLQCACGCKISVEPHVDPLETDDDYCFCGYHFSDNADLVTLWVDGCPPIKKFNKDKTEYELDAYTYKDVKEIAISTNTFDSEATVELPEDLTLKAGQNKFEVKVIAENQKVTKVYTLIINKEA